MMTPKELLKGVVEYFNISEDLEDLASARQSIVDGVSFRGSNIVILILAIFIASLGLNTNSTAVIIGAMLISPLMGPIIGIGLGVGVYDFALIKRATRNLIMTSLFSVATATLYFLISPVSEGHSELLARTQPTIYDVLIGLFGGGAGIVAIACKNKGNVIPGVAIATALMPPLCTAGYGLATWQLHYFFGAFYLFIINSIFIAFATLVGVKLFHFPKQNIPDPQRRLKIKRVVYSIVLATAIPAVYLTAQMLHTQFFIRDATRFVNDEVNVPNTQIFSQKIYTKGWKKYVEISLIGDKVNTDSLTAVLASRMDADRMLRGTHFEIRQGIAFSSRPGENVPDNSTSDVFHALVSQIERQRTSVDSLRAVVMAQESLDSLSYAVAPELKVLYPEIQSVAIGRMVSCRVDDRRLDTINIAIIRHRRPLSNPAQLRNYLETRTGMRDIRLM